MNIEELSIQNYIGHLHSFLKSKFKILEQLSSVKNSIKPRENNDQSVISNITYCVSSNSDILNFTKISQEKEEAVVRITGLINLCEMNLKDLEDNKYTSKTKLNEESSNDIKASNIFPSSYYVTEFSQIESAANIKLNDLDNNEEVYFLQKMEEKFNVIKEKLIETKKLLNCENDLESTKDRLIVKLNKLKLSYEKLKSKHLEGVKFGKIKP